MDIKWRYGLIAVIAALLAIVVLVVVAMFRYPAAEVNNVVGTALGAIGTLVGAYFGVQVGSAGKAEAEKAKDVAQERVVQLAAAAPVETGVPIVKAS
ncbi:hypothetical protein [Actinomycetospora sp.]|jgi:Na+/H+ antiporter NhaC|uniref:hypothetical protein n=1 Tax=Actinomycetospora sp. TaxID=1872135 RepID=UPI002F41A3F7